MIKHFRIHGDNIVECERLFNLITKSIQIQKTERFFLSPACPSVKVITHDSDILFFAYFPGFNKSTSDRWTSNIFQILKDNGSFLNETPDVLLTEQTNTGEKILLAIEFCSALQAGNQAWQRSGRAYSTARANICPYLYIIDFVKYELDKNRNRKALRFPNVAIPYSYYNASKHWKYPAIQVYFQSEEFQPSFDSSLQDFDTSLFGESDVYSLLCGLIYNTDITPIYTSLIQKSLKIMDYMTTTSNSNSYTKKDWASIQNDYSGDILAFSKQNNRFPFAKKITQKSITGHNKDFANLATKYSTGIASKNLPFGLIPSYNRIAFANELLALYPEMNNEFYKKLTTQNDLIICMFKGFKPHGDDARPDRGVLPLIAMLFGETIEILTFVYGDILESTIKKLDQNILSLSNGNGLWSAIVSLSDFIILDAPKIPKLTGSPNIVRLIPNRDNKTFSLSAKKQATDMLISPYPTHYIENDVDTFIHTIFNYIIPGTFEGFCNPPGGDWSGISLINNMDPTVGTEFRWLTLPRVSDSKRPDHITILFNLFEKPLIICTESKELARNLETNIGPALTNYIYDLLSYRPSVERPLNSDIWAISTSTIATSDFICASIGCFFASPNFDLSTISSKCNCDVLMGFSIDSSTSRCKTQIEGFSDIGNRLAHHLKCMVRSRKLPINIFDII